MGQRPLGSFEEALTRTDKVYGMVVVSVLRLRQAPAAAVLRQALDRLQARHPMLRAHIAPRGKGFIFELTDTVPPILLRTLERKGEGHWKELAQQEINRPFGPSEAPLLRCTYLTSGGRGSEADLLCAFHHAILDAESSAQLFHELLSSCSTSSQLKEAGGHTGDSSSWPPPAEALFPPDYRGARLFGRLLPFVLRQLRQERSDRKMMRESAHEAVSAHSSCHIHSLILPREVTQPLIRRVRKERLTLNSVLAGALLMAVYKRRYRRNARRLQVLIFSSLRPYLRPAPSPACLGCYIAMLRVSVSPSPDDTLWSLARVINAEIYEAGRQGEKLLAAMMSKRLMQHALAKPSARMATTALSYVGPVKLDERYGQIELEGLHGFITTNPLSPVYSASGHLFRGRLTLDCMYQAADMGAEEAKALADEIRQLLQV